MAKPNKLKQKLKASDRRRRRRVETTSSATAVSAAPKPRPAASVDVVGLFVDAIVRHADKVPSPTIDLIVVAALRSSQKGTLPSGEESSLLASEFFAIRDREDVSDKAFLGAIRQLLTMSSEHQDSKKPGNQFVRYLSLLAG